MLCLSPTSNSLSALTKQSASARGELISYRLRSLGSLRRVVLLAFELPQKWVTTPLLLNHKDQKICVIDKIIKV